MNIYGMELNKRELLRYISSMTQIAGTRVIKYQNGRAGGVKAIDVKNGSGLNFTVLIDRGMDIADAEYCGIPVAWMSKNGIAGGSYFESEGNNFLRTFVGGLITTCGLTQVGEPCLDGEEKLGLHDRISHTPAEKYYTDGYWEDGDYILKVTGQVRESNIYAENLLLRREILCKMGESKIYVNDVVENEGYNETPFMLMYHINFCFPVLSQYSRLYSSAVKVEPLNEDAKKSQIPYDRFLEPSKGFRYECHRHFMPENSERVYAGLINEKTGIGAYVAYSPKQLPYFNEWKMTGEQDYVVGLEPGNALPEGRINARKSGRLAVLREEEKWEVNLEIGFLKNREEINGFLRNL